MNERLLVVKLSSFGDLFHALPAVHVLKTEYGATITWVTQPEYVDLVSYFTDVSRVIAFPRHRALSGLPCYVRAVRDTEYDLVVDLQGLLKSAVAARIARAPQRIGPSFHREGSRLLYSSVAGRRNRARHAVEENLDTVRALGLACPSPVFPVAFPVYPVATPRPRIAIFPVSRWASKNWGAERYAEVARGLQKKAGATIFIMGSASDAQTCGWIEREAGSGVQNLCGRCNLVQTGGVLGEMDLVLSNDSGPIHMAAAIGTPVLALFGPTDPVRTGPYGPGHRVIRAEPQGEPCHRRLRRRDDDTCMRGILPEAVLQGALEMLAVARTKK
jgi:heptosyltransferase-1